jgi:hypothetical protein
MVAHACRGDGLITDGGCEAQVESFPVELDTKTTQVPV